MHDFCYSCVSVRKISPKLFEEFSLNLGKEFSLPLKTNA